MARGPRRKPAEIALKQGNPGKRKKAALEAAAGAAAAEAAEVVEVSAGTGDYSAPDWLDERARTIWAAVTDYCIKRQLLRTGDLFTLARYCAHCSDWLRLREEMRDRRTKSGIRVTARSGTMIRKRPEFLAMLDLEAQMRAYEDRFGLNPSARAAVLGRLADIKDPVRPPMAPDAAAPSRAAPAKPQGLPPAPASPIGVLGQPRTKLN